ncbi:hypothetical protein V494_00465 [Pseudogymnoascus sp. VKM F-4513 (FW-928)]|nr:hypothetical protein V494_00465 [Pseudogymnoascus sp. VKM F-4513 (FW-928)]
MEADVESPLGNTVGWINLASAQIPAKQRAVKINRTVKRVASKAFEDGLSESSLDELVDIVTLPNELDQASIANIIRNLYPAAQISDDTLVKVIGSLGHGQTRSSFPVQSLLLKWLVMVYDSIRNPKVLSHAYSFLFNLLDTIAIRAPLCHLLSLITRRKHVRPFRIQSLLELARRAGNEPPLVGLIRVYKDYYPDVIVGQLTAGRASVFTVKIKEPYPNGAISNHSQHPNPEWKTRLAEIQEDYAQRTVDEQQSRRDTFRVVRRGVNGVKRSRVSVIPEVHTSNAQETSVTLEEIENVNGFVGVLEKIELPNQLVAVMGDPLLQKLLQLKSTDAVDQRVNNWLMAFFEDQLEGDGSSEGALLDMLAAILEYTRFTKVLPPACAKYLHSLLEDWNGVTGRAVVLDLLSYTPITPFEELHLSTFQPLEWAILDDTPTSQIDLLTFYTSIIRNWTSSLLSSTPPPFTSATINALTTHVNVLTLAILQTGDSQSTITHHSILSFYEAMASLLSQPSLQPHVRITTPPSALVYTLHFAQSLSTFSRLCAILALYKRAFETAMSKPVPARPDPSQGPVPESYPKEYVNHFNGFLMDICNCLWRSRAFNTTDTNALGCLLPPSLLPRFTSYVSSLDTGLTLPSLFTLSYSPVLCNLSISYLRELEDKADEAEGGIKTRHAGPVTQKSLVALGKEGGLQLSWADYRLGVLTYLERRGAKGVGELMYNTMKHLMTAREAAGKAGKV